MAIYAVMVAIISGLEVVLFRHAHRGGLLREAMPEDIYRWGVVQSISPVDLLPRLGAGGVREHHRRGRLWLRGSLWLVANGWKPADADRFHQH